MQIHYEDEERARLAARLGHAESVSDADLASSFAAWVGNKPVKPASRGSRGRSHGRRLTAADLEALTPFLAEDDAQEGGYAASPTWYGFG